MPGTIISVFVIGYFLIAFEKNTGLNKTVAALLTGVLCWVLYAMGDVEHQIVNATLAHHLASISEILFFLLGAMTIVELVDAHNGFDIITRRIRTTRTAQLLCVVSLLSFFLSAVLDNLTTAIVMVSLLRKLVKDDTKRKFFAGMVIISANAGGCWSPIGDITTTMLWIGGQISAINIIKTLFIPGLVCMLVPLAFSLWKFRNDRLEQMDEAGDLKTPVKGSALMLITGVGVLLLVPVFKAITNLPPFMGVLLGLGVVWLVSEALHKDKDEEERKPFTAVHALSKIDSASILFFLGILLAIGVLDANGTLVALAQQMQTSLGNESLIVIAIGLLSAVVDNVPLVAACTGMYHLPGIYHEATFFAINNPELVHEGKFLFNGTAYYLQDARLWEFLAYCTGTGGSILIIGSAAGVAVMGMENISFGWYLKRMGFLALLGYFAGVLAYMFIYPLFAVN